MRRIHLPIRSVVRSCVLASMAFGTLIAIENEAGAVSKFFVPPASSPGDYNGNGTVDAPDFNVWKSDFGSTMDLAADGNGNAVIDAADYVVWRDHLGSSAAPEGDWAEWRKLVLGLGQPNRVAQSPTLEIA